MASNLFFPSKERISPSVSGQVIVALFSSLFSRPVLLTACRPDWARPLVDSPLVEGQEVSPCVYPTLAGCLGTQCEQSKTWRYRNRMCRFIILSPSCCSRQVSFHLQSHVSMFLQLCTQSLLRRRKLWLSSIRTARHSVDKHIVYTKRCFSVY